MTFGLREVLDEMGGARPPEAPADKAEGERVHLPDVEPGLAEALARGVHRLLAVVGTDHRAVRREQPGRLEPLAAPHVEHGSVTESFDDGPVTRRVQREQRVRGHPLHRALAGQPLGGPLLRDECGRAAGF